MTSALRTFAALLLATAAAHGFVPHFNASGALRRWQADPRVPASARDPLTGALLFSLGAAGYSTTNTTAELNALRAAFAQWQAVPGAAVRFTEGPLLAGVTDINSFDGTNTIFWVRTNLLVNGGRDNLAGVLALTYTATYSDNNAIADADTVFNGVEFRWFTDINNTTTSRPFIESVALHEVGHFLGLQHSPAGGATMLFNGGFGVTAQLGLSADELAGARSLYPGPVGAPAGSIRGAVRRGGAAVFGAMVIAEDIHGNLAGAAVTRADGTFELSALPAGEYAVRATPLDSASQDNALVRGRDIAAAFAAAETDFRATTNRPVTVGTAGPTDIELAVETASPRRIVRLLTPEAGALAAPYRAVNKPVLIQPAGQTLFVGVFMTTSPGAGAQLRVSGDGVTIGRADVIPNASGVLNLVAAPMTFSRDATPGLRSVAVEAGGEVSWANGFLEILPPVPDGNFDGLDDQFQRRYFPLFTALEAAPGADPDDDGFNNARELAGGSDPTNQLSPNFSVESVRRTVGGSHVRWQAGPGKRYQLWGRDTVTGSAWFKVGDPVTATGEAAEQVDAGADQFRFYRVEALFP